MLNLNPYQSPSYTDGALLLLAERLKNEVENLYERVSALEQSDAPLSVLKDANEELKVATRELERVIEALEGNCYDCSWCKN
ncbi:hypothetical protein P0I90_002219 [Vibrio parahaemolyticus]|nr:hypothetical protein [Vibrio parahaemolyticus]